MQEVKLGASKTISVFIISLQGENCTCKSFSFVGWSLGSSSHLQLEEWRVCLGQKLLSAFHAIFCFLGSSIYSHCLSDGFFPFVWKDSSFKLKVQHPRNTISAGQTGTVAHPLGIFLWKIKFSYPGIPWAAGKPITEGFTVGHRWKWCIQFLECILKGSGESTSSFSAFRLFEMQKRQLDMDLIYRHARKSHVIRKAEQGHRQELDHLSPELPSVIQGNYSYILFKLFLYEVLCSLRLNHMGSSLSMYACSCVCMCMCTHTYVKVRGQHPVSSYIALPHFVKQILSLSLKLTD